MITSKECIICHKTKKVSNFYTHRDNKLGHGLNMSCKECDKKTVIDINGLRLFCDTNNRLFSQDLYDLALKTSTEKYENDVEYNSLSEEKRESFLFEKIRNIYFSRMGGNQYYSYLNTNTGLVEESIEYTEYNEDEAEDSEPAKKEKEKKTWSEKWQGTYTKSQISFLDSYYFDTTNDFIITTRSHKDYVKKIAKASLAMDESFDDMMQGIAGADKRYKENKAIFDSLSQSAKLSEKTRSANEVSGLGSLSEIVAKLEQTGFLQRKITFPKDDIDQINEDFRWALASVGGEL